MTRIFPLLLLVTLATGVVACSAPKARGQVAPIEKRAVAEEPATRAQAASSRAKSSETLETVYREPADRPAPIRSDVRSVNQGQSAQARVGESELVREIDYEAQGAPAGTNELAARLLSIHAEDVPDEHALQALDEVDAQLLAIESLSALNIQRNRALSLMRYVPTEAVLARLVERGRDASEHPSIRAAALRSLRVVARPDNAQEQQVLQDAAQDPSPRIRAAVRAPDEADSP